MEAKPDEMERVEKNDCFQEKMKEFSILGGKDYFQILITEKSSKCTFKDFCLQEMKIEWVEIVMYGR